MSADDDTDDEAAEPFDVTPDGEDDDERRLDEAELESFPASDPHSEWQGPSS